MRTHGDYTIGGGGRVTWKMESRRGEYPYRVRIATHHGGQRVWHETWVGEQPDRATAELWVRIFEAGLATADELRVEQLDLTI